MIRLAIPLSQERFAPHFGRCDGFYICDIVDRRAERPRAVPRPKQRCESVPDWLKSLGVTVVLTQGIGAVAVSRLTDLGLLVLTGGRGETPEELVRLYLAGWSKGATNTCQPHDPRHCKANK